MESTAEPDSNIQEGNTELDYVPEGADTSDNLLDGTDHLDKVQGGTGDVPKDEKKNIRPGRGVQPLDYRQSQRIVLNAKPVQLTRGMLWVEKVK